MLYSVRQPYTTCAEVAQRCDCRNHIIEMTSRTKRIAKAKRLSLPENIIRGLQSLVGENANLITAMLDVDNGSSETVLVDKLVDCMNVNNLSAEMLLARFFDASVLGQYCTDCLGKSSKGSSSTLASRIAREWSRPNFTPIKLSQVSSHGRGDSSSEEDFAALIHAERHGNAKEAATKHAVVEPEARSEVEENDKREASPELHRVLKKKAKKLKGKLKLLKSSDTKHGARIVLKMLESILEIIIKHTMTQELVVGTNLAKTIGKACKLERPRYRDIVTLAIEIKNKIVTQLDENDASSE